MTHIGPSRSESHGNKKEWAAGTRQPDQLFRAAPCPLPKQSGYAASVKPESLKKGRHTIIFWDF